MNNTDREILAVINAINAFRYKVIFEHIKGKDNILPDIFSQSSILQE